MNQCFFVLSHNEHSPDAEGWIHVSCVTMAGIHVMPIDGEAATSQPEDQYGGLLYFTINGL